MVCLPLFSIPKGTPFIVTNLGEIFYSVLVGMDEHSIFEGNTRILYFHIPYINLMGNFGVMAVMAVIVSTVLISHQNGWMDDGWMNSKSIDRREINSYHQQFSGNFVVGICERNG